ncbi:hypothetical protein F5Y13DRAFT_162254 [Hypoxylon sp. FL1857]|nr:hypothetical protein F5Y13DRAFT_162254 [Hypoxylon sp. FL1857]
MRSLWARSIDSNTTLVRMSLSSWRMDHRYLILSPSKSFSESLTRLVRHKILRNKLHMLATFLQYVNILRTKDCQPWDVPINDDSERNFFIT